MVNILFCAKDFLDDAETLKIKDGKDFSNIYDKFYSNDNR